MSTRACLRFFFLFAIIAPALLWVPSQRWRGTDMSPEIARIQAHLLGAERMAAARDLSGLTPEARKARLRLLRELRDYRDRGVFPTNRDFAHRMPYFVDATGVRCAMAHLIEIAGGGALVQHVARTRNNAYVRELVDEPGLLTWLDRNGLTAAEAARIQPGYEPGDPGVIVGPGPVASSNGSIEPAVLATTMGLEAAGIFLNLTPASTRHSKMLRGWTGIGVGFLGATAGAVMLAESGSEARARGVTCGLLGVTSMALGMYQLNHREPPPLLAWRTKDATGLAVRVTF
jgi:hypothetical protein